MLTLDKRRFRAALKSRGLNSVLALSRTTGLHRNTINYYLSGHSVYQQGYLRFCAVLGVSAHDLVCSRPRSEIPRDIALLLDHLTEAYPHLAFILFGSRARYVAKEFSDWDVGFFTANKISHDEHLGLLVTADKIAGDSVTAVELVNLNDADDDFLADNREDFIYLTGSLTQWGRFSERLKSLAKKMK